MLNAHWRCFALLAVALAPASLQSLGAQEDKTGREAGEFGIYMAGQEIGTEKYTIVSSGDSISSSSIVNFRNPGGHEKFHFETKLDMDAHYVPRTYELKTDVGGKRGSILGSFRPNEAIFEYQSDGPLRRTGLMVGSQYTMLDTNIFHHFIFLARLFDFDSKEKTRRLEVIIPQEADSGFLNIADLKRENIVVRGKKVEAHHLQADSGALQVQLWVDDRHILHKIVVKDKDIEVVRNPRSL